MSLISTVGYTALCYTYIANIIFLSQNAYMHAYGVLWIRQKPMMVLERGVSNAVFSYPL